MIFCTPSGIKHTYLGALIAFSLISSASAESVEPMRCNDLPSYHLLDFWVGDWDVYVGDEKVGHNRIEKTLNGCAVTEHWVDSAGNEGTSLFFVNDGGQWKQIWVTERANRPGGVKEKTNVEIAPEDGVRFQGVLYHPEAGQWFDRTTLKSVGNGAVSQVIEISSDAGNTWETTFDAIYRRVSSD
jgi:hypothetical protein